MNRQEQFIITINRQFGTGGHEIGAEIARRLNVKLFDKQILQEVAREFNIGAEVVDKTETRIPSWRDDFAQFYRDYVADHEYHETGRELTTQELFDAQAAVIKKLAEQESCVIIGRCAFDIFRNHPNALKIFIHSTDECRKRRIAEKYGLDERDAGAMIVDNDYSRELYTKSFTGTEWTDARNYDITLDVRKFGVNGAVDFLMKCIE